MFFMKTILILILPVLIFMASKWETETVPCKNSPYLLEKSKRAHDPKSNWNKAAFKVHIQEPRVGNPQRFTKLKLDNRTGFYEMDRNRDEGIVKRRVNGNGEVEIFLNGKSDIPESIVEKYGLNSTTTRFIQKFYRTMYGLPMALEKDFWTQIDTAEPIQFYGKEAYRIPIVLTEEIIAKNWGIILSRNDYRILGLELNHPENPNQEEELIKFEGAFIHDQMEIPRIRHWYIKGSEEYLGTDIIVEKIE
jgi:hypothetical protein